MTLRFRPLADGPEVRPPVDTNQAVFGMNLTLRRDDGREQTFRIVGEDEANVSRGTVSDVSPFARTVLNHSPAKPSRLPVSTPSLST
jgi:transcription elongation GreA/GreB family factor